MHVLIEACGNERTAFGEKFLKISDGDCVRIDIANFELTLLKSALRNDKRGGLLLHLRLRLLLLLWALGLGLWLSLLNLWLVGLLLLAQKLAATGRNNLLRVCGALLLVRVRSHDSTLVALSCTHILASCLLVLRLACRVLVLVDGSATILQSLWLLLKLRTLALGFVPRILLLIGRNHVSLLLHSVGLLASVLLAFLTRLRTATLHFTKLLVALDQLIE